MWIPLGDVNEGRLHPARAKITNGLIEQFNIGVGARLRRDKSARAPKQSVCTSAHGVRIVDSVTRIYKESPNRTIDGRCSLFFIFCFFYIFLYFFLWVDSNVYAMKW